MKICIVGKYPPIEGGVSTTTYWLARGLARRGHEVHVVTNADEIEPMFRITLQPGDAADYQPMFERGGRVCVYNPAAFTRRMMTHIPEANPFVTKLASVAVDVIRRHGCEVVVAYYYEPYAVAGYLASQWTERPLIVKHAGSDLERLLRVPDLATTYKEILRSANVVLTRPRLAPRFVGMGVPPDRVVADIPYSIPTEVFCPAAKPLDLREAALHDCEMGFRHAKEFDAALPTIGVYGKIGRSKGTYDLVTALGALRRDHIEVNLAAMIGRSQADLLASAVREAGLEPRTYILPLLPNWRVPAFVRACTAVAFLERDFPIAIHGPVVPREILACGTCLILSKEIAAKQQYRDLLRDGESAILVADPKDHVALASAIRSIAVDPGRAVRIGTQGLAISRAMEDHDRYIAGWEQLLVRLASARIPPEVLDAATVRRATLESTIPELLPILARRVPGALEEFLTAPSDRETVRNPVGEFCNRVIRRLASTDSTETRRLLDVVRYIQLRSIAAHDAADAASPAFPVVDQLQGQLVTSDLARRLRPTRASALMIAEFDHEVTLLHARTGQRQRPGGIAMDLGEIPERRVSLLFHRTVNLVLYELHIDPHVRALVDACDGSRTTAEVLEHMDREFGGAGAASGNRITTLVLDALDWLYREGMIVFGEYRDGWGWSGGPR